MEFKIEQSKKNWQTYKIIYIVMLVIAIVAVLAFSSWVRREVKVSSSFKEDGDGPALLQGRGSEKEDTETLLNRLEWSTYYESRINRWYRMVVITIIIVVLIMVLGMRKLAKPSTIIVLILAVFIPMLATHHFYYAHGDIYNDYYMWKNLQIIRKRLYGNAKYEEPGPPHPEACVPQRVQAMNQQ